MKNINFLWRENYIDYLWATETTGKHYFFDSGYLIYREGVLSAYATDREIKKALSLTSHLVENPETLLEIKKDFLMIKNSIVIFHNSFSSLEISKLSNKDIFNLYLNFINLYGKYIESYRFTEPHLVKHIENKVKKIVSKVNSIKTTDVLLAEILSSKNVKLHEHNLLKYKDIFNLIESVSKLRFEAKKIIDNLTEDTDIILRETAKRTSYAVSQISNMSLDELKKLLINGVSIDTYKPNLRTKIFGIKILIKDGKTLIRDMGNKQINTIERTEYSKEEQISGSSVYPGKVKGLVRLVPPLFSENSYKKYLSSLKKGDIIVASMTSPNLTMGFSKISGVITDEGGLMSHAALVSREYKIPCIVGTRIATKFLKDGDRILLDADNGVIKKI